MLLRVPKRVHSTRCQLAGGRAISSIHYPCVLGSSPEVLRVLAWPRAGVERCSPAHRLEVQHGIFSGQSTFHWDPQQYACPARVLTVCPGTHSMPASHQHDKPYTGSLNTVGTDACKQSIETNVFSHCQPSSGTDLFVYTTASSVGDIVKEMGSFLSASSHGVSWHSFAFASTDNKCPGPSEHVIGSRCCGGAASK